MSSSNSTTNAQLENLIVSDGLLYIQSITTQLVGTSSCLPKIALCGLNIICSGPLSMYRMGNEYVVLFMAHNTCLRLLSSHYC